MNKHYTPLAQGDSEFCRGEADDWRLRTRTHSWRTYLSFFALLVLTNGISLTWRQRATEETISDVPQEYAQLDDLPITWKTFLWNTEYSSVNRTQNDKLWDAIRPSHGVISVDRSWAAERHWPVSGYLPDDKSKGVYLLEAYHHLHCLRIIRKTFWEAVDNQTFTYAPGHHMEHCFDTLRQSVMCYADNTPLYSFGDNTAGDGQVHKCHDWNALRTWATEHTACYRDSEREIALKDHFGFCDNGLDGLG